MDNKQKILLIEDEDSFRKGLVRILERNGYHVYDAPNSQDALRLAADIDFDLVVSDVRLPGGLDGIDLVHKIKESKPDLKTSFIIITGYAGNEAPIRAIKVGVDDFIYKPFESEHFLHSVKRNLRIGQLERKHDEYLNQIKKMKDELQEYNQSLENKVKEKTQALSLIFDIGKEITASLKLEEVLATIVERTAENLNIEICSIVLVDEKNEYLYVAAARGLPDEVIKSTRINFNEQVSGWVLQHREPLFVPNIDQDARFKSSPYRKYYTGSFISVPLVFKERVIGIIHANNKSTHDKFNGDDLNFLKGVADQASIAISNARLYRNLEKVYLQVIATLTSIIELKDNYTKRHSERVTKYSILIADAMNLPKEEKDILRLACQLHDLGKIGVHDYVLTKPDRLSDEEWDEMKRHPQKGVEILRPLHFLSDVLSLVEHHHERFDGKGYPSGQKEKEIDLGARIMAVADSFDAMTTKRPYSPAFTIESALGELQKCRGSQFDPKIVDIFVEIIKNNPGLVHE